MKERRVKDRRVGPSDRRSTADQNLQNLASRRLLLTIVLPLVGTILFLGYIAFNENRAYDQGSTINTFVRTQSNCLPKPGETTPRRPNDCKEGFDQAVNYINAEQSCLIVQKAVPLLYLNGQQIGEVVCRLPNETTSK